MEIILFQTDLISNRTTNVITIWYLRDDKTVQSEFTLNDPFKLKSILSKLNLKMNL